MSTQADKDLETLLEQIALDHLFIGKGYPFSSSMENCWIKHQYITCA